MKWRRYTGPIFLAIVAYASMAPAQTRPAYDGPKLTKRPAASQTKTLNAAALRPSAPRTTPSLLTLPAKPAKVTLIDGKLTIHADNSTLSGILDQISHDGGMKVVGLKSGNAAQRIFGSYGPGAPREVLSSLLNGTGYNSLMFGASASGVPQTLTLSKQAAGGVPNPPPSAAPQYTPQNNYNYRTVYPQQQTSSPPPQPHPNTTQQVRTPQQMLQELEQMHRRAAGQQPNNQN